MLAALLFILTCSRIDDYSVDPYVIFAQSDSALCRINSASYSFSFKGTGALSNILPEVQGTTCLGHSSEADYPLMIHVFTTMSRQGVIRDLRTPSSFIASSDSLFFVDHSNRIVHTAPAGGNTHGMFDFPPASVLMEIVIPMPFSDELNADSIAVLYPAESNGIQCHVFHVFYDDANGSEAVWYIGIDDLLPRAVERINYYGDTGAPGGQKLEISEIITDCPMPVKPGFPEDYRVLPWNTLPEAGSPDPGFFLSDSEGFARRSSEFNDKKLLVCFFSSWDPVSLSTLGLLKSLLNQHPDAVNAVGISTGETVDPGFRLEALEVNFPILFFGEDAAEAYSVYSVPAVFLISTDGVILHSSTGTDSSDVCELENLI